MVTKLSLFTPPKVIVLESSFFFEPCVLFYKVRFASPYQQVALGEEPSVAAGRVVEYHAETPHHRARLPSRNPFTLQGTGRWGSVEPLNYEIFSTAEGFSTFFLNTARQKKKFSLLPAQQALLHLDPPWTMPCLIDRFIIQMLLTQQTMNIRIFKYPALENKRKKSGFFFHG